MKNYTWNTLTSNLSEPFFDTTVGTHVRIETRLALTQNKLTNPTPEGFRGLIIDVCGMFVGGMWDVCGMIQSGGRQETPRTADVTVTKIAGYVRVRILMNR